jgi:hypothetical protein
MYGGIACCFSSRIAGKKMIAEYPSKIKDTGKQQKKNRQDKGKFNHRLTILFFEKHYHHNLSFER